MPVATVEPTDDKCRKDESHVRDAALYAELLHPVLPDESIGDKPGGKWNHQTAATTEQTADRNQRHHRISKKIEYAGNEIYRQAYHDDAHLVA